MFLFVTSYIDPGQGSIVLQLIIAGVTGLGFYLVLARKRIVIFFRKLFFKKQQKDDPS